ncbi:hypothetical protein RDV89_10955 [Nocardioides zeae]|uniref:Uncharacterized protein n=1 Tax=Nocardioides imazamoxiresistens TaxID=3231893 RepID=A0ABU3PWI3_9ACTN|nr:hypothetical protein [Nocardioides zeae]MDT9593588.1 hypothetical protein [Nocardioides zeae]
MDLSGVIFVAVAIAWAAYLIPQALKHHDEAVESRSVERFSATLRVLVRRGEVATETTVEPAEPEAAPTPAQLRARRAAARRAMQRRRRVLGTLLALLTLGIALAAFGVMPWGFVAAPSALLVTWLVTCRVMVKGERAAFARDRVAVTTTPVAPEKARPAPNAASSEADLVAAMAEHADEAEVAALYNANAETSLISAVSLEGDTELSSAHAAPPAAVQDDRDPSTLWEARSVPLPTYVSKDHAAARELPAFDFDDTGVWSSGRDDADSDLVRRNAAATPAPAERDELDSDRRAVGH